MTIKGVKEAVELFNDYPESRVISFDFEENEVWTSEQASENNSFVGGKDCVKVIYGRGRGRDDVTEENFTKMCELAIDLWDNDTKELPPNARYLLEEALYGV